MTVSTFTVISFDVDTELDAAIEFERTNPDWALYGSSSSQTRSFSFREAHVFNLIPKNQLPKFDDKHLFSDIYGRERRNELQKS